MKVSATKCGSTDEKENSIGYASHKKDKKPKFTDNNNKIII